MDKDQEAPIELTYYEKFFVDRMVDFSPKNYKYRQDRDHLIALYREEPVFYFKDRGGGIDPNIELAIRRFTTQYKPNNYDLPVNIKEHIIKLVKTLQVQQDDFTPGDYMSDRLNNTIKVLRRFLEDNYKEENKDD